MSEWRPDGPGQDPAAWTSGSGTPSSAGAVPPAVEPAFVQPAPPDAPSGPAGATGRRSRRTAAPAAGGPLTWLRETAIILLSALVLSLLVKTFLVQAFWIPSQSMHDTLIEDDRILVNKLAPGPVALHRGDVVVFKDPGGWLDAQPAVGDGTGGRVVNDLLTFVGLRPVDAGQHLVKRLIGLPGDVVSCQGPGQQVTVNGVALDEPYLAPGSDPCGMPFSVTVPPGSLWVMGDNRDHSEDSRYHQGNPGGGAVPESNVVGVAFVVVWPADRWTLLHNPSATFAKVPDAA